MQKFKTELHCHTKETSMCGKVPAIDILNAYIDAGYQTLVVSDHFGAKHVTNNGEKYDLDKFFEGYSIIKDAADGRINVILGMEINLLENKNDYLLFGITEDFIRSNYEMYKMNISDFSAFVHENGILIYQAHPFRNGMTVVQPALLDGIEAYNAHPRHDSRNNISNAWADLYGLQKISGSDTHQMPDIARGGILTEKEIKTIDDLMNTLKSNEFELIISD